jgi:hypothetical protein
VGQSLAARPCDGLKKFIAKWSRAMNQTIRRNRLLPWYIGIAVIIAAEIYVGYEMFYVGCPAPVMLELAMLIVIPLVYLVLMYLTFVSQE